MNHLLAGAGVVEVETAKIRTTEKKTFCLNKYAKELITYDTEYQMI